LVSHDCLGGFSFFQFPQTGKMFCRRRGQHHAGLLGGCLATAAHHADTQSHLDRVSAGIRCGNLRHHLSPSPSQGKHSSAPPTAFLPDTGQRISSVTSAGFERVCSVASDLFHPHHPAVPHYGLGHLLPSRIHFNRTIFREIQTDENG